MIAGLGEEDAVVLQAIDQAVFLGDAPGADSRAEMAERFGFADADEWVAADGFNEFENPERGFPVNAYPMSQVFKKIPVKNQAPLVRTHLAPVFVASASSESCWPSP